jgi:hypothetical protein
MFSQQQKLSQKDLCRPQNATSFLQKVIDSKLDGQTEQQMKRMDEQKERHSHGNQTVFQARIVFV